MLVQQEGQNEAFPSELLLVLEDSALREALLTSESLQIQGEIPERLTWQDEPS